MEASVTDGGTVAERSCSLAPLRAVQRSSPDGTVEYDLTMEFVDGQSGLGTNREGNADLGVMTLSEER